MGAPAGFEIRPVSMDEAAPFFRALAVPFGAHLSDDDIEREKARFFPERSLAAFDGGRIVATAGSFPFELTLPGLRTVGMGGVSYVSVLPTHRRRGILTALMRRQLDDFYQAGDVLAGLTASEAIIYGRFGYGLATSHLEIEVETVHSRFLRPVDDPGRCLMLDKAEAAKTIPAVHDRARLARPGDLNRFDRYWDGWFADSKHERHGATERFYVVHESESGELDGYLAFRRREGWPDGLPRHALEIEELRALHPTTEAVLWRFALDVDLVDRVRAEAQAPDDPLRWMLADARRVRVVARHDHLWVRLLDLSAALEMRGYGHEGELVLDVDDAFCEWNTGRWRLSAGPDGASCERDAGAEPDLALSAADLGAVYLGGVRVSTLARAGRVDELQPGALRRADDLFRCDPLPWCTTGF